MKHYIMASPAMRTQEQDWLPAQYLFSVDAIKQWSELRNAIESCGNYVNVLPVTSLKDTGSIFIAKAGVSIEDMILTCQSAFYSDSEYETYIVKELKEEGYAVDQGYNKPAEREKYSFSGSEDAILNLDGSILWYGFGFKSTFEYKAVLDETLDIYDTIVRGLELVDPVLNTLNKCMCVLESGDLLWYPEGFSEHSQYIIEQFYEGRHIPISREDALDLVCQSISIDMNIITSGMSGKLEMLLNHRNYNIITVNVDEFLECGFSCASLVLLVE